jgi:hypothetical protein
MKGAAVSNIVAIRRSIQLVNYAKFEDIIAALLQIKVFWDVTLSLVKSPPSPSFRRLHRSAFLSRLQQSKDPEDELNTILRTVGNSKPTEHSIPEDLKLLPAHLLTVTVLMYKIQA